MLLLWVTLFSGMCQVPFFSQENFDWPEGVWKAGHSGEGFSEAGADKGNQQQLDKPEQLLGSRLGDWAGARAAPGSQNPGRCWSRGETASHFLEIIAVL